MTQDNSQGFLSGKLLIAMPSMQDPRFSNSVILLLMHDENHAMGVVINKPAGFMHLSDVKVSGTEKPPEIEQMPVYYGGPVENEVALILHSSDRNNYETTRIVNEHFCITSTPHILKDISKGDGPLSRLFLLGYASWGAGQLEHELKRNDWLITNGTPELVFNTNAQEKWYAAIQTLGIHPALLSAEGGNA